jgi:hypothetical protein
MEISKASPTGTADRMRHSLDKAAAARGCCILAGPIPHSAAGIARFGKQ